MPHFSVFQIVAICPSPDTVQNLQRGANDYSTHYLLLLLLQSFLFKEENVANDKLYSGVEISLVEL